MILIGGSPGRPVIGWHNLFRAGEVDASSVSGEHVPDLAFDGITSTGWRTVAGEEHWIEVELAASAEADYAAIAAHTLAGCQVVPQRWTGSAWADLADAAAPASGAPVAWEFASVAAARWRLRITEAPDVVSIGALHIGRAMRPATGIPAGWQPPSLNEVVEHEGPISVGGALLARQVRRRGVEVQIELPALGYAFARGAWRDFLEAAQTRPFFVWWLGGDGLAEVVYGGLVRQGGRLGRAVRADLSLSIQGITR